MHAEIIAIGTEILLGEIIDTNSAFIAKQLQRLGVPLFYTSTVGDDLERIVSVIRHGLSRSQLVITTGGLGPTVDDLTRIGIAQAIGRPLIFDERLLRQIEERFRRWGRPMTENNRQQAYRPADSIPIENPVGTAPAFMVDLGDRLILSLPGVPREMEYLIENAALPYLRQRFNLSGLIKSRELKVAGLGESMVDEKVGELEKLVNPTVGLNAKSGVIIIRITAAAETEAGADRLIAEVERTARERLGDFIFGADADTLESVLLAQLARRGETVAVYESGNEGRLGGKLAEADRSNKIFRGSQAKPLTEGNIDSIAQAVAREFNATWGLACRVESSANGLSVSICAVNADHCQSWQRGFGGHPALVPEWSANMALDTLRRMLD